MNKMMWTLARRFMGTLFFLSIFFALFLYAYSPLASVILVFMAAGILSTGFFEWDLT